MTAPVPRRRERCVMEPTQHRFLLHRGSAPSSVRWRSARSVVACLSLATAVVSCSSPHSTAPSETPVDASFARRSSSELAQYVFDHHGCKSCHTLGRDGKLGLTDRGTEVGRNFEGCISLLTAMNTIVQVKEENRSAEDRRKAERFRDFGCTDCHQITSGKVMLTAIGKKLASLHMGCPDVERLLSRH